MANFWTGLAEGFDPRLFSQIYGNKQAREAQEAERKAQITSLAELLRGGRQATTIQPNKGITPLGTPEELGYAIESIVPFTPEEMALRYSQLGNEGQQAYNLYQKLREPKSVKYSNVFEVGGKQFGINDQGQRVEIGGAPIPEAKPIFKYDSEFVELENPITKQRTPLLDASGNPIVNERYKPVAVREEITGGKYNPKLGKIVAQKVKYDKSGKAIYTEDYAIEPDKASSEQRDIMNEVVTRQQKDLVDLGDYIDEGLRKNIINEGTSEKPDYKVKVGDNLIPVGEYRKQLESEFKQKASTLADITKSTLTPKARTLLSTKWNQLGGKQLDPMEFQRMTKEAYKNGDITAEDYKKMSGAYFDATYGLFRRR